MAMNMGNCPRCGKVFVKNVKGICPACIKDIDMKCEECVEYLQENRGSTMNELSEAVGVSLGQISKFIREGRISILKAPNMSYPCETCGSPLREGTICESCRSRLAKNLSNFDEDQKIRLARALEDNKISYQIRDRLSDRR